MSGSSTPSYDGRPVPSSVPSAEKQTESSNRNHKDDPHKPIVYRKLTFETELPVPPPTSPIDLKPPDLRKLVSPYDWSPARKAVITGISSATTIFSSFAASSLGSGAAQMSAEWHVSEIAILVGITMFTAGFAIGPMFLAPLSEVNGRRPVFIATAILFAICQLCCSVTRSFPGMLVARFFAGIGGSTFSTMVGGIIADIYQARDRNTPMAVFSGATLFGTGLGPLVSGFIAEHTTWRWIFYIQIIVAGIICAAVIIFLRETRGVVVLRKRAKVLNKWYENLESAGFYGFEVAADEVASEKSTTIRIRWKVAADEERDDLLTMLRISLLRPFQLLFTEPVVFFFSLWAAFSWSVLYINLAVIPFVFESTYKFSLSHADAIFTATCIASALAMFLSIYQERWAARRKGWNSVPEHRLYFSCVESILLPVGLFMFGWTSQYHVHWIVPALATGISTVGIFSIYLAVFNYLADVYHRYASSALAAQSFCRNILGGAFPLVSRQMFNNLSFGPASSILGGIGVALTAVPWVLVFYGPHIRARSKLAR